ncbi:hypothetical protein EUTSA_v10015326mg [Eutrema salsugineum]|uniref:KIB1-4 beta-propeller domain-containing protein n=1 Tax=Eutrema salsugineum TaxID=72664 RepID=V4NAJ0_EUTSA|nr:hypothetical protein EUTSA_v10015326mg [Eutrema salsugineum]
MSLLLSRLSKLSPVSVRRSSLRLLLSNGFSSYLLQTPPCSILGGYAFTPTHTKLIITTFTESCNINSGKKVPNELVFPNLYDYRVITIGASHGWVATLNKDDGILRLQDDLNPYASNTKPKRISLPPLVALPLCQTNIVTNVAMSTSSPEDEDCVVAVKFLGPQLSFCRPSAADQSEWTNVRIENPCFFSSRVMFSKKDDMFRIPGSGGHLIASWDLRAKKTHKPKIHKLRFRNLPKLTKSKRELMDSCLTSVHLVESTTTGEIFLVKLYKKTASGTVRLETKALMVFKLDDEGNAVYTQDIGDLVMFLSKSEPFCVPASSFPHLPYLDPNSVELCDVDEDAGIHLATSDIVKCTLYKQYSLPYSTSKTSCLSHACRLQ